MRFKLLGYGEVGKAIYDLFNKDHDIFIHDPALGWKCVEENIKTPIDYLLVCIPFDDRFIHEVLEAKGSIQKTIIFSTVPIGTIENIKHAIHIPIEGVHPKLLKSLKKWEVMVGIEDKNPYEYEYRKLIDSIFKINKWGEPIRVTEACKLLSTLLYGVNIEFMRYANMILKGKFDAFNVYNIAYNKLYKALNIPASRYLLYPPEGLIGGHCVRENAKLLPESFWTDLVRYGLGDKEVID